MSRMLLSHRRIFASVIGALSLMSCENASESNEPKPRHQPEAASIDDRTDEERPPFVDVPGRPPSAPVTPVVVGTASPSQTPAPESTKSAWATPTPEGGGGNLGFGVFGELTCDEYIRKFWNLGAETTEEAPGPVFTKIKFTSKVMGVTGTRVTLNTKLDAGSPEYNLDEMVTFDACTEPFRSAIPNTAVDCKAVDLGIENITVNGRFYKAKKTQIGECKTTKGETYQSIVWRAAELPLWGVLKREVTGTIVPKIMNGKISPTTVNWKF